MDSGKAEKKKKDMKALTGKLLPYLLIAVFFVCVVFSYYRKLYSETMENIISKGQINAIESSHQIAEVLQTSLDILKLAGYTLDNMLRENRPKKDMLDYLTNETVAVGDSLITDTTGIYGYIDGEYMDGSGWVPEEGYEPTERPWYTEAMANNGKIVIVDPYLDLDTGNVMIAIARTLEDGESVVSIDLSMAGFQRVIDEHVAKDHAFAEFIINKEGFVIAHSDKKMVGTYIDSGKDPLSLAISEKLSPGESGHFYIELEGRDYMVYAMPLENEWTCISVIDATEDFSRLRIPLVITILTALILIVFFSFLINRAEKKSREAEESEQKTEEAMAASEAKTAFLSNMSHEIRTPINAILGMNEMILRECTDEGILVYAENVRAASNTLLGLVNDILDFSKIEAGKMEINPVDYDLSSVINDLVSMVAGRVEDKGLVLKTDFDPETPKLLYGDEIRVKQVITNILTNAVKYTEKGGITFRVGYENLPDEPDSVLLKVAVIDTGIGIRPEDMRKLFSEFERIEEKRNRSIEGTGLGMSITKNLLEMMGSKLRVGSVYGEGSVFSFALKQKVVKWERLGDYKYSLFSGVGERERYKEKFTAGRASVLVVDDNSMNLQVFKSLIKKTKIWTETADSGDEGIRLSLLKKYDIIFLDHMMPGKDGIETLREIKANANNPNLNTPYICLTANAISGARQEYINAGFDDYLTKPIDVEKLDEMLLKYLPGDKVQLIEPTEAETEEEDLDLESIPLPIRKCPLIDEATGVKNSGSLESYLSLLKIFYESIDDKADEIGRLYEERDFNGFAIKVHALKSSARIIGAEIFGEEAQRLEDAGKKGDERYIDRHAESFLEDYLNFKDVLREAFPDEAPDSKIEADEYLLGEVYEEIKAAAADMDCDRLDSVMKEMEGYSIAASEEERWKALKEAADRYDYEEIKKLLQESS